MILKTDNGLTLGLIFCSLLIVLIIAVGFMMIFRRRASAKGLKTDLKFEPKVYAGLLANFYQALGGMNNVVEIKQNHTKKCITVVVEDPEITMVENLFEHGLMKREFNDKEIDLYFIDYKTFYKNLFGK